MWQTKRLLIFPYFCFGLDGTLSSSNPSSVLRWMDLSVDISFLPNVGLHVESLAVSKTSIVAMGILSVVAMNWRTGSCAAYRS
jgi:hypothetical protein